MTGAVMVPIKEVFTTTEAATMLGSFRDRCPRESPQNETARTLMLLIVPPLLLLGQGPSCGDRSRPARSVMACAAQRRVTRPAYSSWRVVTMR